MTTGDLINIFLRLEMAGKDTTSDLAFDTGVDGQSPFAITGVRLDEDGDVCLESDERSGTVMSPKEIADAVLQYGSTRTVYFVSIDRDGESELFNIKDGGTKDRQSSGLQMVAVSELMDSLKGCPQDSILHFESGTINFTVNSVYTDECGCLCLESNEIMELDDYPVSMLMEELSEADLHTGVYFYDDDSREYYGIYPQELRTDDKGDVWINVR